MGFRTGSVTFGGLQSGIPTNNIIESLLNLERRPIQVLEDQKTDYQSRLTIFQDLSSKTLALRDTLRSLDNLNSLASSRSAFEEFARFEATSSDTSILGPARRARFSNNGC